ncbi:MAG: hypothetical protein OXU75_06440 [Deltaproteobacteria bacterium]|nr:hypothetical protein [Deltaproteobacteria bacterium]
MIREGGVATLTGSRVDLLAGTQFSTITQQMNFVVRCAITTGVENSGRVQVRFRRGSIALSEVELPGDGEIAGGIQGAEDAELFRGRVMPGNLYLEVSQTGTSGSALEYDITAF